MHNEDMRIFISDNQPFSDEREGDTIGGGKENYLDL